MLHMCTRCPECTGGAGYAFDAETGPRAVFARFFGTANPYEALSGEVRGQEEGSTSCPAHALYNPSRRAVPVC
jgi:hypothetical protein